MSEQQHKIEQKLALKRAEMAVADAEAKSGIAPDEIDYKKEIKNLKRRLTNALKQRDDWAAKYAKVMSKKNENNSCISHQQVVDSMSSMADIPSSSLSVTH